VIEVITGILLSVKIHCFITFFILLEVKMNLFFTKDKMIKQSSCHKKTG